MKKKAIAALLCALALLLCGCAEQAAEEKTEASTAAQTEEETLPPVPKEPLTGDGTALYVLVRADEASTYWVSDVVSFRGRLNEATGAQFELTTDWHRPGDTSYATVKELLLGSVDRDESRAFTETLQPGEYGYEVTENKIVVAGRTYELNALALEAFLTDVIGSGEYRTETGYALPRGLKKVYREAALVSADGKDISLAALKIDCLGASNTAKTKTADNKNDTKVNYPALLAEILKCDVRNYGVSGTNLAAASGRTDSYVERIPAMKKDADIVIIQGEGNDATHNIPLGTPGERNRNTFCGALAYMIDYVRAKMPDARLIVVSGMSKKNQPSRQDKLKHEDFHKAFMETCRLCGVEAYDFTLDPVIQPKDTSMMPDGLHMSHEACQRYAEIVAELVKDSLK